MQTVEKYISPKELVDEIEKLYGLPVKYRRIIEIRMYCEKKRNRIFVNGLARASDVYGFMQENPDFKYKRY